MSYRHSLTRSAGVRSYQLVDAERNHDERQKEVGDGKAGDDAVGHVLEVPLQQQRE